jgi:group I intron endonuclease
MKEKIIGIYKITNPNGKIYIGQSTDVLKRFQIHKGLYGNNLTKLERSFNKYGIKNHKFELLEECSSDMLDKKEKYWIYSYNSINEGLNIEVGGNGGYLSDHTKNLISKKKKNHPCYSNPQRGKKISKALKGREKNWGKGKEKKGKKQLKEFKDHVSKIKSTPILQYNINGEFIKEWDSIINASKTLNVHREAISSNLRKITKTSGGYVWRYKN